MPRPTITGLLAILIAVLAMLAGYLRNELVIILLGTVFFAILGYCFFTVLILGFLHKKKAKSFKVEIVSGRIMAGENGEIKLPEARRFFGFPGTVIRYELKLSTRDGRTSGCFINPTKSGNGFVSFPVPERGAYYGGTDEFLILDGPGFFRLKIKVKQENEEKLLAMPRPAQEKIPFFSRSGGSEKHSEIRFKKSDSLVESRPYVPGDDPRRINWKLYGHAPESELYVREEENAPPPHSRLLVCVDTQIDPVLYNTDEGRNETDMLCENALGIASGLEQKGIETLTCFPGGKITLADAEALARPSALPMLSEDRLPDAPFDTGILVLAAPRLSAGNTALDDFLIKSAVGPAATRRQIDLIFLYSLNSKTAAERKEAAMSCLAFYKNKNNIIVRCLEIVPPES